MSKWRNNIKYILLCIMILISVSCTVVRVHTSMNNRVPIINIPEQDPMKKSNMCLMKQDIMKPVAQETSSWCWAASAQEILTFHGVNIRQCKIVSRVMFHNNPICCNNVDICQNNGWPDQVFNTYGMKYEVVRGALSQRQIAAQLCQNGPFMYMVTYPISLGGGGHTEVVVDYWIENGEMYLMIDSHHSEGFQKVAYTDYLNSEYHTVDRTYILFTP